MPLPLPLPKGVRHRLRAMREKARVPLSRASLRRLAGIAATAAQQPRSNVLEQVRDWARSCEEAGWVLPGGTVSGPKSQDGGSAPDVTDLPPSDSDVDTDA